MAPDFVRYNPQDSHVRSVRHDPCGFFFRVMHPNIAFLCEDNKRAKCKHTQNTSRYLLSALSSERICPPSSRVSPFCLLQSPGQGNTRLSHIKRRRLIMPLVALVQKITAHPQLRTLVWCSALPSSSPLLLAFRLRKSECFYKNAPNKQSA